MKMLKIKDVFLLSYWEETNDGSQQLFRKNENSTLIISYKDCEVIEFRIGERAQAFENSAIAKLYRLKLSWFRDPEIPDEHFWIESKEWARLLSWFNRMKLKINNWKQKEKKLWEKQHLKLININ